jgi:hypothetical protein
MPLPGSTVEESDFVLLRRMYGDLPTTNKAADSRCGRRSADRFRHGDVRLAGR